jgi:membrane fusion protein
LFRREILHKRGRAALGDAIIVKPLSFRLLAFLVALVVAAIIGFLVWGRYSRKQAVEGYLLPDEGLIKIYAPTGGIVVKRAVEPEQRVHKGDVLFVVSTRRSSLGTVDIGSSLIADAINSKQTLRSQIDKAEKLKAARVKQIEARTKAYKGELAATQGRIKTETQRLTVIKKNLGRLKPLLKAHLVAPSDYQKQYEKVLGQRSTIQALKKTALDLKRQVNAAPSKISIVKLDTASKIAEYRKNISQLNRQSTQYQAARNSVIHAPADGTVAGVVAEAGQQVRPNRPLMTLLPKDSVLTARLLVPTSAIGFIQPGEDVRIRYAAFPYQRFGLYRARVTRVSKAIFSPTDLNTPVATRQPFYLVTAKLGSQTVDAYGKTMPLQAGMLLSADIIIDHESLIHWILTPLYSLQGTI